MTRESFADLLFFTRAAVLRDPVLANARIEGPLADGFGRVQVQGRPDLPDAPALSLFGLYRVWDESVAAAPCHRCGARRLFLDASGGFTHRPVVFIRLRCPFCRETDGRRESRWANFQSVREAVRAARLASASAPDGLPFADATLRLRVLRDADLLDPAHPLETASLAAARIRPPVLTGHPPADVEDARLRALVATPDRIARVLSLREEILAEQGRVIAQAEAALAPLRGRPGVPGPKERFRRGELPLADYRAILERKRSLADSVAPDRLRRECEDRLVRDVEADLGRRLSSAERRVFLEAVEDGAPGR